MGMRLLMPRVLALDIPRAAGLALATRAEDALKPLRHQHCSITLHSPQIPGVSWLGQAKSVCVCVCVGCLTEAKECSHIVV